MSTVYAGELQGIILALQIAETDWARGSRRSKLLVYTDNQAAIRSSANPKGKSGAYLLQNIAERIQQLRPQELPTEIRWTPAHTESRAMKKRIEQQRKPRDGEKTGKQARQRSSRKNSILSQSTLKTWTQEEASKAWQAKWTAEARGRTTVRDTPRPTKKMLQLHEGLSKRHSAILVEMRTEKIGLKDFLFNRRVPDATDNKCTYREGRQTVSHVLMRRRRFRQLRHQELGSTLGRHGLRALLNGRKAAAKAIRLMEQTEILGQTKNSAAPSALLLPSRLAHAAELLRCSNPVPTLEPLSPRKYTNARSSRLTRARRTQIPLVANLEPAYPACTISSVL